MSFRIWVDITDPKYALFFAPLILALKNHTSVLITTRGSEDYSEVGQILKLHGIKAMSIGAYGGGNRRDKFIARMRRQNALLELFKKMPLPCVLITGASVDGVQVAYALGIKIVHFFDTPFVNGKFSKLAILSLPLSDVIFYPFVLGREHFAMAQNSTLIEYPFIDPALYLGDLAQEIFKEKEPSGLSRKEFFAQIGADSKKPLILVREEEYKAHYVEKRSEIIYECVDRLLELDVNIAIMPRYGVCDLRDRLGQLVIILERTFRPEDFYPHIDVLLGGGGSMNLEACFLGIPTISVRSLFLPHDLYLLEHNLMSHAKDSRRAFELCKVALDSKRRDNRELFFKDKKLADFSFALGIILPLVLRNSDSL